MGFPRGQLAKGPHRGKLSGMSEAGHVAFASESRARPSPLLEMPVAAPADGRRMIALRIWDWSEWCRQVVRGVQSYAHDKPDWRLFVDVGQTTRPQVYSDDLRLDGIITHVLGNVRAWKRLLARGRTSVVSFATAVPRALDELPRVRVDDERVAEVIGRHLVSGGLRRFAYCGSGISAAVQDVRQRAVEAFAAAHGYPCSVFNTPVRGDGAIHLPSLKRWITSLDKPVGIVAWNIDVARRVVQACKRIDVAVPALVSIVAWDDDPMLAETLEPTISAAVLPAERLGFEAAKLLDQVLQGAAPSPPSPVIIQPTGILRVRQSSDMWALKDREVYLALQFIREHASGPLKVPQIARHVGVSRKKLELDFARVVKQTPYEAIVDVRMERAKQLLLDTGWEASRVAERSGIGDASTLRRWFLLREGLTPTEYRTRYGAAHAT
jgi:LacI family transcriptional regulator